MCDDPFLLNFISHNSLTPSQTGSKPYRDRASTALCRAADVALHREDADGAAPEKRPLKKSGCNAASEKNRLFLGVVKNKAGGARVIKKTSVAIDFPFAVRLCLVVCPGPDLRYVGSCSRGHRFFTAASALFTCRPLPRDVPTLHTMFRIKALDGGPPFRNYVVCLILRLLISFRFCWYRMVYIEHCFQKY